MAFTDTSAVAGLVKAAYDRYVEFSLRSQPLLRSIADKRPVQQAMPGSSVVFSIYADLAPTTTTLTETVDPDAVAMSDVSTVTVTLAERGNSVLATRKFSELSFADVDPSIANIVAYNMADSLDAVVAAELENGTNLLYGSAGTTYPTARNTIAAEDTIKAADLRKAVAKLRAKNAVPRQGTLYTAWMHPEVVHDLRAESGAGTFEDINKYTDASGILNGVVGVLHGAAVVETPRVKTDTGGATSTKVYRSYIAGQQALAEAVAVEPGIVIGPVVDRLMRHRPIGWYALLGHKVFRNDALYRIESASTIAA